MKAPLLSVTIITFNEAEHLPQAIKSVQWADETIVVDSGSTDNTVQIAEQLGAKVFHHPWPGYGQQKNFAQKQTKNDWVLNIDADEVVPLELAEAISEALLHAEATQTRGFYFPRKTFYLGKWIRHGGWYPNHLVRLANKKFASWTEPEVHESLEVEGEISLISEPLLHYTFQSIEDQVRTNLRYSRSGSRDLIQRGQGASLIKLLFKPIGKFLETYFIKRGFLDGLAGFLISVNAAHSMFLKYAYLFEGKLSRANPHRR